MKIAITGHTKGIGKSCQLLLESKGHYVIGFSRSNGYDVSLPDTCKAITDCDADVIINNAYHETGQYFLLRHVFQEWRDKEKTIINVGSLRSDFTEQPQDKLDYALIKRSLTDYSHWISNNKFKLRSMLFKPSWVNTEMGQVGPKDSLMSPEYCAEVIEFMINSPYTIKELSLCNMK